MEKKIKALALFSGGLDSALAVKVVKKKDSRGRTILDFGREDK